MNFPLGVTLDLSRLIIAGHSFGGVTAIGVAAQDPRVKAVLTLDPWLLSIMKEVKTMKIKQPLQILYSETFESFGRVTPGAMEIKAEFLESQKENKNLEVLTLKNHGHHHQADLAIIEPIFLRMESYFNCILWTG